MIAFAQNTGGLKLVVVHNHFRPGGVRRVIELAAPHVARALRPCAQEILLVSGESPDAFWLTRFRSSLAPLPVRVHIDPAAGYVAEHRLATATRERRLHSLLSPLLADDCVVWAHNQGLGRNLPLSRVLAGLCASRNIPLVFHHHDWWFDNRWTRWPELRRSGANSLARVAASLLPASPNVRHAAINQADASVLRRHFGSRATWLPNPGDDTPRPSAARARLARRWLTARLGDDAPVWIVPCRLLRRKNLAEALLLTRWLRPEAWLVTTGGISSTDEARYAQQLAAAAKHERWKLRLSILATAEDDGDKPSVPELLAASEAVLLTSLQEGFGLPYIEAAAARRPLIARSLPNVAPDLARFGLRFPHSYRELLIAPTLFDWTAETRRQRLAFHAWRRQLPLPCRKLSSLPPLLAAGSRPQPVPFSRLTLDAQLEVLRQPADASWALCAPLNPFLLSWRHQAALKAMPPPVTSSKVDAFLGGAAYTARFDRLLRTRPSAPPSASAGQAAQTDFIRRTLHSENLYPLSWSPLT